MVLKKLTTLILSVSLVAFLSSSISFSQVLSEGYTLDQVVEKALEVNENLKTLELNKVQVDEGLKKANDGASMSKYVLKQYQDYIQMYEIGEPHIQKYKTMTMDEVASTYTAVYKGIMNPFTSATALEKLLKEEKYIEYIFMFGLDEPSLNKREKYEKYIQNIELTGLNAEYERDKFYNIMEKTKSTVEGSITNLYLSYHDLKENILLQNNLLTYYDKNLKDVESRYNSGSVSKNEYLDFKDKYNTQLKNIKILELRLKNLENTLKNQLQIPMDKEIDFIKNLSSNQEYSLLNKKLYMEMAKENSADYINAKLDLDYKNQEIKLYEKYIVSNTRDKQDILSDLKIFEHQYFDVSEKIEANVLYVLEDLYQKEIDLEVKTLSLEISKDKFLNAKQQYEIGLITYTQLLGIEASYIGDSISKSVAERGIFSSKEKFRLLIENGIDY